MACYHLNDLAQAEDALCEANILNNLDSTVWAYLMLVCIKVHWNCVTTCRCIVNRLGHIAMVGIHGGNTIST